MLVVQHLLRRIDAHGRLELAKPSSRGPFAAQSRDDPEPYSFPANTTSGMPSFSYFIAASKIDICSPSGKCRVMPPSVPEAS